MYDTEFQAPSHSYWMASTVQTNYPELNEDLKVDVAVIGGGIAGLTCAYLLSKEGLKVAVIEADRIVQGTTGHTTAKTTSQHNLIYNKIKTQIGEELAKQITDIGSQIYEQSRIVDIDGDNPYLLKTAKQKTITAEKLIIASHYLLYNKGGLYTARIYPDRSYVVVLRAAEPYPGGMYINAEKPTRSFRSQPFEDRELILVGGESHKAGQCGYT